MLHFTTLSDKEVVYTWENPDPPGGVRMWCVDRLQKWCEDTKREILHADIDPERAKWFEENRGVEKHRIDWLLDHKEALMNPCLMMRMPRDKEGEHWDLMLDGHHRYVALSMLEHPFFLLYHVTEEEAREFEVTGFPQPEGPLNVYAFSGLGMDR